MANDTLMPCKRKCNVTVRYQCRSVMTKALVTKGLQNEKPVGRQDLTELAVIPDSFPEAIRVREIVTKSVLCVKKFI